MKTPRNARRPHEVPRVSIVFDPELGRTHQSFREECDVNRIVDTYTRTGVLTHAARGKPQFGDAPDSTLFEAAVAQAEIRSAEEEGRWPLQEAPEAPVTDSEPESEEKALEPPEASDAPETAAEG